MDVSLQDSAQFNRGCMHMKCSIAYRFALIGCLCLANAPVAKAAQDGDLKKVGSDSQLAGRLAGIGQVFSGSGASLSMASGFLVSSCHVLTAGHVLAKVGEHVRLGAEVRFFMGGGRERSAMVGPVRGVVVAASQNFTMQANPEGFDQERIPNDWALVELEHTIAQVEPLKLLYQGGSNATEIAYTVAGYPLGQRGQALYAQEHCAGWANPHGGAELKDILIADCAVRAGMSGGPILLDDGNQLIAAGIMVERFTIGEKVMTIGVPVSAFANQITEVMRESNVCAVGSPFVLPATSRAN